MAEKMLTPRGTYRIIPRRWFPIKNFMLKKYGITLHLWYKIWYHPNTPTEVRYYTLMDTQT